MYCLLGLILYLANINIFHFNLRKQQKQINQQSRSLFFDDYSRGVLQVALYLFFQKNKSTIEGKNDQRHFNMTAWLFRELTWQDYV